MIKKEREIALEILKERSGDRFVKDIYSHKMEQYGYLNTVQKALIKRLVQGTAEREYTLDYYIRAYSSLRLKKIEENVLHILRLSVYQILFMDKIPMYSIVNDAVNLVKKVKQFRAVSFTNALLHKIADEKTVILKDLESLAKRNPSVAYSFPEEVIQILREDYSEAVCEGMMAASLQEKPLSIRLIRHNDDAQSLVQAFPEQKAKAIVGEGILFDNVYKYNGNIEQEPAFQAGYIQVQDESSMLVGHLAAAECPKLIYDVCAAPGGKAAHLAGLLPQSRIIASDIRAEKVAKILENKNRLRLENLQATIQDACEYDIRKQEPADCVIADVPCSGLGVIGSKPDIKYRINKQAIQDLNQIQSQILKQAAQYVKPGGVLFYSTCTITAAENQQMVRQFLQEHPEFTLYDFSGDPIFQSANAKHMLKQGEMYWQDKMLQILPQTLHGFFIAKLRKTL